MTISNAIFPGSDDFGLGALALRLLYLRFGQAAVGQKTAVFVEDADPGLGDRGQNADQVVQLFPGGGVIHVADGLFTELDHQDQFVHMMFVQGFGVLVVKNDAEGKQQQGGDEHGHENGPGFEMFR